MPPGQKEDSGQSGPTAPVDPRGPSVLSWQAGLGQNLHLGAEVLNKQSRAGVPWAPFPPTVGVSTPQVASQAPAPLR